MFFHLLSCLVQLWNLEFKIEFMVYSWPATFDNLTLNFETLLKSLLVVQLFCYCNNVFLKRDLNLTHLDVSLLVINCEMDLKRVARLEAVFFKLADEVAFTSSLDNKSFQFCF